MAIFSGGSGAFCGICRSDNCMHLYQGMAAQQQMSASHLQEHYNRMLGMSNQSKSLNIQEVVDKQSVEKRSKKLLLLRR